MSHNLYRLRTLTAITLICTTLSAHAGIQILGTRLLFFSNKKEASIEVQNTDAETVLIQTWIDPYQGKSTDNSQENIPFFAMPPLSRLDEKQRNTIRVRRSNQNLPEDRESVFWLNIKEIPQVTKEKNALQFAINTRLKLFFRPAHLSICTNQAYQQLQWQITATNHITDIKLSNPTPCFITLSEAMINQTHALTLSPTPMIAPFSSVNYSFNTVPTKEIHDIRYRTINDYGGLTPALTVTPTTTH